jgi:hypothetical protein
MVLAQVSQHQGAQANDVTAASSRKRSAFGARVSFIEVPQSIEVPHSRNLPLFELLFFPPFKHSQKPTHKLHERLCRSLPFEALSPKRASNDHARSPSQGSITVNQ